MIGRAALFLWGRTAGSAGSPMADTTSHPSLEQLAAFDGGRLPPRERTAIEDHVSGCAECCARLEALPDDVLVALVRSFAGLAPAGPDTTDLSDPSRCTPDSACGPTPLEVPAELRGHPRYRVLRLLDAGGMGVVFRAIHRLMDRVVALKVVHRRLLDQPAAVERFRQEVKAAARLHHPNIVTAYDADQAGETHFLVMEYVEGRSLGRVVEEGGPLPVRTACEYSRQIALALQHAHEAGMVHRDLKPANVLVTAQGQVKVLDFGLARFVSDSTSAEPHTPVGTVVGTPDYMAPEQAHTPQQADVRADLYSLGCLLYFVLTGRPPFHEGSVLQKLLAHQERRPRPLAEVRGDVPAGLAALVERLLAKDPAQRPSLPAEVARGLAPFAAGTPPREDVSCPTLTLQPTTRRAGRRARGRWLLLAGGLTAAGVLAVVLWLRTRDHGSAPAAPGEPAPQAAPAGPADLLTPEQMAHLKRQRLDQAAAWLRQNNRWGPEHIFVEQATAQVEDGAGKADAFLIQVGGKLLKSGRPALLAGNTGGFFPFELTPEQARELMLPEGKLGVRSFSHLRDLRRASPGVVLSGLHFEGAPDLDGSRPVSGAVTSQGVDWEAGGYALRLSYFPDRQRRSQFAYRRHLQVEGATASFTFAPLHRGQNRYLGPLAVFLEVVSFTEGEGKGRPVVESNCLAALLEVRAGAASGK
jgi:predicted Ser/Thr protein kinase